MPGSMIYEPLDATKQEIRLLVVDKADAAQDGTVSCHLETVSLLSTPPPQYEAVSWCWGDQKRRKHIRLNGQLTDVSENAEQVLRRIGLDHGHTRIWMDAVCINQKDIAERSQQVTLMREVYSKAERVLAWLGEDEGTTSAALESIDLVLAQCREVTEGFKELQEHFLDSNGNRRYSDEHLPDCDWSALSTFYSAGWFFRVWIVQEIMLAKEAICFRGRHFRSWSDIGLAAQWMSHRNFRRYSNDPGIGVDKASRIWRYNHIKPSLTNLLSMNLYLQATEPRDKVYGILGLLESLGTEVANLVPDYTADLGEVYAKATRAAFELDGLSLLDTAQVLVPYDDDQPSANIVPSWVPRYDWRDYRPSGSPANPELPLQIGAAGGIPMAIQSPPQDARLLRIKGILVDNIVKLGSVLDESLILGADNFSAEVLNIRKSSRSFDHEEWDVAFALTSNLTHGQANAEEAPDFLNQYRHFVEECKQRVNKTSHPELLAEPSSLRYFSPTAWAYANTVWAHSRNRRFFMTSNGYMGIGFPKMQLGDRLCILFGTWYPFVLRPDGDRWKLVGSAYVHDMMEGEYVRRLREQGCLDEEARWFDIH